MQYYLIGDDWFEYDANGTVTATHHNYDTEDNIIIIAGETTNQNTNVIDYRKPITIPAKHSVCWITAAALRKFRLLK